MECRMSEPLDELDDLDVAILGQVRAAHDRADPPPADLNDRVRFAIRLAGADGVEVFRRFEDAVAGARDDQLRTLTFESDALTVMATLSPAGADAVRVEGWLAPAAPHRVRLRMADTSYEVVADADGRFTFDRVPTGLAQLVVDRAGQGPLITGSLALSVGD
jgi:hypothetical protein